MATNFHSTAPQQSKELLLAALSKIEEHEEEAANLAAAAEKQAAADAAAAFDRSRAAGDEDEDMIERLSSADSDDSPTRLEHTRLEHRPAMLPTAGDTTADGAAGDQGTSGDPERTGMVYRSASVGSVGRETERLPLDSGWCVCL